MSAFALQKRLVADRLQGRIPDQFLIVEHPPVITMGRNARPRNLLKSKDELARLGVEIEGTIVPSIRGLRQIDGDETVNDS